MSQLTSKPTARTADSIIIEAIEGYRDGGLLQVAAYRIQLTETEWRSVGRRLVALGAPQLSKKLDKLTRISRFVRDAVQGSPVTFSTPEPSDPVPTHDNAPEATPEASIAVPGGWSEIEADDPAPDAPTPPSCRMDPGSILATLADAGLPRIPVAGDQFGRCSRFYAEYMGTPNGTIRVGFSDNRDPEKLHSILLEACQVLQVSGYQVQGSMRNFRLDRIYVIGHATTPAPDFPGRGAPNDHLPDVRNMVDTRTDHLASALQARARLARVDRPDTPTPVSRFSGPSALEGITADEVIGSMWPDGEFDASGRIRRSWMRAIESGIRMEIRGLLESHEITGDLDYTLERAALAYSRMDRQERRDWAEWLAFLDYKPGEYLYGRLAPDEAWVEFVRESIEGAPVFFPVPTLPGGGDGRGIHEHGTHDERERHPGGQLPGHVPPSMLAEGMAISPRRPALDRDAGGPGPDRPCHGRSDLAHDQALRGDGTAPGTASNLKGHDHEQGLHTLDDDQRRAGVQDVSQALDSPRAPIDIRAGRAIHDRDHHGASVPALAGAEGLRGDRPSSDPAGGHGRPVAASSAPNVPSTATHASDSTTGPVDGFPFVVLVHGLGQPFHQVITSSLPTSTDTPRPSAPHTPPRSFLTLTIGNREYGLTIDGDTFTLEHPNGTQYDITRGDDSSCSCPSFQHRCKGLHGAKCKHQVALRQVDLLTPVPDFPGTEPYPGASMSGPPMPPTDWKASAQLVARKLRRCEAILKRAYLKLSMDHSEIGSNEISDEMATYLADMMGDRAFCEWLTENARYNRSEWPKRD